MRKRLMILCILSIVVFCAFSNFAFAEEKEDVFHLGKIIITPSRSLDIAENVSAPFVVIMQEEIKKSNAQSILDLLKSSTGVIVRDWYGNGIKASVDIRGFGATAGSNVLTLIDGRRTNQIDLSGADWSQIPLDQIDKVEILRGSGSVLYGDNSSGGVINIITKRGYGGKPQFEFVTESGSYQYIKESAIISGSIDSGLLSGFDYFFNASNKSTNGYRQNSYLHEKDFGFRVGHGKEDFYNITIRGNYHESDYGLPGPLSKSDLETRSRRDSKEVDNDAGQSDGYISLSNELEPIKDVKLMQEIGFRRRYVDTFWNSSGYGQNSTRIDSFNYTPKLMFKFLGESRMIAGFDFYKHDSILNDFEQDTNSQTSDSDVDRKVIAYYTRLTFNPIRKFTVNLGYRHEESEYEFDYRDLTGALVDVDSDREMDIDAYEAGLAFALNKNIKLYASWNKTFRFPATDEFMLYNFNTWPFGRRINEELTVQKSNSFDVGITNVFKDKINLEANLFYMDIDNEIYYDSFTWVNDNYPATMHRGVELSAKFKFLRYFSITGNYTYTEAKFDEGIYDDNDIPAVPKHKASSGIAFDWNNINCNIIGNYVGSRRFISDLGNKVDPLDDYLTIDATASYTYKYLEVFGRINNIFDEKYSEYAVTNAAGTAKNFYPSPEMNFQVGLRIMF